MKRVHKGATMEGTARLLAVLAVEVAEGKYSCEFKFGGPRSKTVLTVVLTEKRK